MIVPFNVNQVVTADASVVIQVFQTSGSNISVNTGADFSHLNIRKVADYLG